MGVPLEHQNMIIDKISPSQFPLSPGSPTIYIPHIFPTFLEITYLERSPGFFTTMNSAIGVVCTIVILVFIIIYQNQMMHGL